jgi:hypothetical protein
VRIGWQLEAELRWHDEFDRVLASLPEPEGRAAAEGVKGSGAAESVAPSAAPGAGTRRRAPGRDQHAEPDRGTKKRRGT